MRFEGRSRIRAQLDVAPLVDVVFLLLIFFLLTSNYVVPRTIDLVLPASSTSDPHKEPAVIVSLSRDGSIRFRNVPTTLEGLQTQITDAIGSGRNRAVILETDGDAPVQAMVRILDTIRDAGASNVALATTSAGRDRATER